MRLDLTPTLMLFIHTHIHSQAMQRGVLEENLKLQEQIAEMKSKQSEVENRWVTMPSYTPSWKVSHI